jgi:hypothetical protein
MIIGGSLKHVYISNITEQAFVRIGIQLPENI